MSADPINVCLVETPPPRMFLEAYYLVENIVELAIRYGTTSFQVYYWLQDYNIPLRDDDFEIIIDHTILLTYVEILAERII